MWNKISSWAKRNSSQALTSHVTPNLGLGADLEVVCLQKPHYSTVLVSTLFLPYFNTQQFWQGTFQVNTGTPFKIWLVSIVFVSIIFVLNYNILFDIYHFYSLILLFSQMVQSEQSHKKQFTSLVIGKTENKPTLHVRCEKTIFP